MRRRSPRAFKDLNQGAILPHLVGVGSVAFIGMLAQTLFSIADLYFVGLLGPQPQAAVAVVSSLGFIVMALAQLLSVSVGNLVAQAIGRRSLEAAQRSFDQGIVLAVGLGLVFLLAAWSFGAGFCRYLAPDAGTAGYAEDYLHWVALSMALQLPVSVMGAGLRGIGHLSPYALMQTLTVLVNLILSPILVLGLLGAPGLGIAGAGLASLIAVALGALGLCGYFVSSNCALKLEPMKSRLDLAVWARILTLGLPIAVELLVTFCYSAFVIFALRKFGPEQQAAFGAGQRILTFFLLPGTALCAAIGPMVAQAFGASMSRRIQEIVRTAMVTGVILGFTVFSICHFFAGPIMRAFSVDPAVQTAGSVFLEIMSLYLPLTGIALVCFGVLAGLGNTVPTLVATSIKVVLVVTIVAACEPLPGFSPAWIWCTSIAATSVQMAINYVLLTRQMRKACGPPATLAR